MELACDIVRKKTVTCDIDDLMNDIRKLGINRSISEKLDKHMVQKINQKFNSVIIGNDDIGHAILLAYFISSHTVNEYKLKYDAKLINAANALVSCIENGGKTFFDCVDHYYSLYKMFMSMKEIEGIESLFGNLEEKVKVYKLSLRKGISAKIDVKPLVDDMFDVNPKIATKKLLSSYRIISSVPIIADIVWDAILNSMKDKEHMFLIMVAELRILLVPKLTNIRDRKRVYYDVDIEDLVRSIRDGTMIVQDVIKILHIFGEKIGVRVNNEFDCWDNHFSKFIVDCFRSMFDEIQKMAC